MAQTRRPGAGTKPQPTALRILRGNPGKRALPAHEAKAKRPERLPSPPPELSESAKREWRRTGRKLLAVGLLADVDEAAFGAYCASYARWLEANALLAKTAMLIKDQYGQLRPNPLLRIVREAQEQFTRALTEFGMSPSSRTRVHATPSARDADPFDAYVTDSGSRSRTG